MLTYDPLKRPTTQECLDHAYFKTIPKPTHPSKLPKPLPIITKQNPPKRKLEDEEGSRKVARKLF
jgi:cyclin-dependent kinase 7